MHNMDDVFGFGGGNNIINIFGNHIIMVPQAASLAFPIAIVKLGKRDSSSDILMER